jgi:hypothetical protein
MGLAKYFVGCMLVVGAVAFAAKAHGAEPTEVPHNFDFQDGMEYGYTVNQAPGQAARQVATFLFAGDRDGRYQLHSRQGPYLTAIECTFPCDVAKVITVFDGPGASPGTANVQRLRLDRNSVGLRALQDAATGRLKRYGIGYGAKRYTVWVDVERGVVKTLYKKK